MRIVKILDINHCWSLFTILSIILDRKIKSNSCRQIVFVKSYKTTIRKTNPLFYSTRSFSIILDLSIIRYYQQKYLIFVIYSEKNRHFVCLCLSVLIIFTKNTH